MYFIIEYENYRNFQYQTGLNILDDSMCYCYFADQKNINDAYYFGAFWIRPVVVPNNSKIIKNHIATFLMTDKIIVGKGFELYSLKTIKKFNFKITPYYINEVCKKGKIDILEWWKNSGLELEYTESALTLASYYGQVEVLEWWKNSGLELKYTNDTLDRASSNGCIEVLEWWKNSGLELKYTESALTSASGSGHIEVLEWWKNSGLELKYTTDALLWASEYDKIKVLEWWKNSGLELKYSEDWVFRHCSVKVLKWWKNSGLIKMK